MSLHDEIMAIPSIGHAMYYQPTGHQTMLSDACKSGHKEALQAAANLAIKADAEIARLQSQFDPSKFAHRPDCCGPDIDTHCLGCAMAESNKGDEEVAALTIKIAILTGENAVLRDLLRDSLAVICTIDGEDDDEVATLYALTAGIREAIDGNKDGGLFDGVAE